MTQFQAIGRRKTSTARVYLRKGSGQIIVNGKEMADYFPQKANQNQVTLPLDVTGIEGEYDVKITVRGGGTTGQAGAVQLGIARAILEINEEHRPTLREHNLLTRDSRMVERKKYGQPKARKAFQFSKR
ncbi:SSU ribosomal protein S9P [Cyclonatronum proteinivorum]|uniref:Small ribosomal subunit protein uS9 n=1 Tax=Cyclonatronum proteinivorum TaxID=1457365 RepID=A0A345UFQ8_9BACT|nr:30S ribosomal protein S9 [Cyclonatronum proteinivorum]AXI99309.1 SSU ribosomal protein S9P [Cyclonatronum proteinivorum]